MIKVLMVGSAEQSGGGVASVLRLMSRKQSRLRLQQRLLRHRR